MLNENLVWEMMNSIVKTHADSYTELFPCAKIYSYAYKRSFLIGDQVVIENGKIVNSYGNPTHYIYELEATLQDTRHVITVRDISTNELLKIEL